MPRKSPDTVAVIGIDLGKNTFHLIGLNKRGAIVLRLKLSRSQLETRLANTPPCLIGMEACVDSHHLARRLKALGHDARLMPAKYVRPYSKGQKNDFKDAEAIAEAVQRPTMRFVAIKTVEQLDLQALHRIRERLVSQRTGVINQIRAFMLERGIAVRQGLRFLRAELPRLLATREDVLSAHMIRLIEDLAGDWRRLDQRIEALSAEIEGIAHADVHCPTHHERAGCRSHRLERNGGRDRYRRGVLQRARLRRLARHRAEADLDRRSHDPRLDLQARQQIPTQVVRAGRVGRARQADELGAARPQELDRSRQEAAPPQRVGDRARQQAGPHRLGGACQGARLRGDENDQCRGPTRLSLPPCSRSSRPRRVA